MRAQFAVTGDAYVAPVALRRPPRRVGQHPHRPGIRDREYCAAISSKTGPGGDLESRYRSTVLVRRPKSDGRPQLPDIPSPAAGVCAAISHPRDPIQAQNRQYRSTVLVRQARPDVKPYLTLKMCAAILSKTGPGGGPKPRYRSTVPDAAHKKAPHHQDVCCDIGRMKLHNRPATQISQHTQNHDQPNEANQTGCECEVMGSPACGVVKRGN